MVWLDVVETKAMDDRMDVIDADELRGNQGTSEQLSFRAWREALRNGEAGQSKQLFPGIDRPAAVEKRLSLRSE